MSQTIILLFSLSCVALLYVLFAAQHRANRRFVLYPVISRSLAATALGAMLILQSCHSKEEEKDEKAEKQVAVQVPPTQVVILQKGKLSDTLSLPGELTAYQQVDIYAKVSSFVKKLYADVGSEVKEGQLLAVMEAPEINSQLSAAGSKLKSLEAIYIASKANYDRLVETSKTPGTISPNDLDIAKAKERSDAAQLESSKADYKQITDTRNYLEIRAPFSGVISARNVSAGAYVGPSGKGSDLPMFVLQEQKHLRLVVSVPEAFTSYLNDNSNVSFTVRSLPGQTFTAKVKRLAGALDLRLRSEHVEMDVVNDNKKLLPGMVAEIALSLPTKDSTFIVPKTAVVNSTESVSVIKVSNNKAQWINVQKGRQANNKMEIYGQGLAAGDTLVKAGTEEVRDGSFIKNIALTQK